MFKKYFLCHAGSDYQHRQEDIGIIGMIYYWEGEYLEGASPEDVKDRDNEPIMKLYSIDGSNSKVYGNMHSFTMLTQKACEDLLKKNERKRENIEMPTNEEMIKAYNRPDYIKKAISELQGVASLITHDGKIDDSEITYLKTWLESHIEILDQWPLTVIHNIINKITNKAEILPKDKKFLLEQLACFAAGPELPKTVLGIFDEIESISFDGKIFVFTGNLNFSSRKLAKLKVQDKGGIVKDDLTLDTDYLVVGEQGSDAWKHSRYGAKIERAISLRDSGNAIKIITEKDFVRAFINYNKSHVTPCNPIK